MVFLFPWQVLAFLLLLATMSVWAWAPARWHVAVRSTRAGRALPTAFTLLTVVVYACMLT